MGVLDAFGIQWSSLLFHTINFCVAGYVLYRLLYTPVCRVLDKRRQAIQQGLADAEQGTQFLEQAQGEVKKLHEQSETKRQALLQAARKEAAVLTERIVTEAKEQANQLLVSGKERLEREGVAHQTRMKKALAHHVVLAAKKAVEATQH